MTDETPESREKSSLISIDKRTGDSKSEVPSSSDAIGQLFERGLTMDNINLNKYESKDSDSVEH